MHPSSKSHSKSYQGNLVLGPASREDERSQKHQQLQCFFWGSSYMCWQLPLLRWILSLKELQCWQFHFEGRSGRKCFPVKNVLT